MSTDDTVRRARPVARGALKPDLGDTVISPPRELSGLITGSAQRQNQTPPRGAELADSVAEFVPVASPDRQRRAAQFRYQVGHDGDETGTETVARFGRRPAAPRIAPENAPALVRVASPRGEISATHLEVRALGSAILVTDLNSSNGSIVRVPGRISRTLRGGESAVVPPGTTIDLGEGVVIHVVLVPQPAPLEGTE